MFYHGNREGARHSANVGMGLCFHMLEYPVSESDTVSMILHVRSSNPNAVNVGSVGRGSHEEGTSSNDMDNKERGHWIWAGRSIGRMGLESSESVGAQCP